MTIGADGQPDPNSMRDDETGELLIKRDDDTKEALHHRLQIYNANTRPILNHYIAKSVIQRINASQPQDAVWSEVQPKLCH